jgi:anti-sigma regulatory factor (Ser/Thr protein kinase)
VNRMPRRPSVVLAVPSRTEFLGIVRDVARRMAETAGFEPAVAEQVALAVDEAATNVIEHAYAGAPDRVVEVRCEDRGRELQFDVIDNGKGVDPRTVPRVDLDRYVTERRKGGLGVHLMGKIMDSVTFRRSARRNVCRLAKRRPKETPREGEEE